MLNFLYKIISNCWQRVFMAATALTNNVMNCEEDGSNFSDPNINADVGLQVDDHSMPDVTNVKDYSGIVTGNDTKFSILNTSDNKDNLTLQLTDECMENKDETAEVLNCASDVNNNFTKSNGSSTTEEVISPIPHIKFSEKSLSQDNSISLLGSSITTNLCKSHLLENDANFLSSSFNRDLLYMSPLKSNGLSEESSKVSFKHAALSQECPTPTFVELTESQVFDSLVFVDSELLNKDCVFEFPENTSNEEDLEEENFTDVLFFKKQGFEYLENIKTSDQEESLLNRDSLYRNFDPLHERFIKTQNTVESIPTTKDSAIVKDDPPLIVKDIVLEHLEPHIPHVALNGLSPLANKRLSNVSSRESLGNLLSFDSPVKSSSQKVKTCLIYEPKLFTESEFQEAIKINDLTIQEVLLNKQRVLELEASEKDAEKEDEIARLGNVCNSLREICQDSMSLATDLHHKNVVLCNTIGEMESAKMRLYSDFLKSAKDFESVNHTFSSLNKRYEQDKDMLKSYKNNEHNLKAQVESLREKIAEQELKYVLRKKPEIVADQVEGGSSNAKKGVDTQVAVLKARLRKSELKVSSLESNLKQMRVENEKLSCIRDDLEDKYSET